MDTCEECGNEPAYELEVGGRLCVDCLESTGYAGDVILPSDTPAGLFARPR